ncbi:uncharacterized protein LOC143435228 isoform X2 [Arvicanthis niloticus]|uniref:uncharacterized protein LOC143309518 isoform X2 n=1 Tax=Arvicanthis niloticus TaxID=61156 RepID=UPI00402B1FDF
MNRWIPWKLIPVLTMILQNWVPSICGEYRWAILSAFPKPMPVRHDAAVFPKIFTTNKTLDLPYLPYDPTRAPLAVAATTAGFAMATTVQTSTTLNQLSATVAEAMNTHASATAQFKGNWSEGFEETMESLRAAIVTINLTRVDLSLTEGFSFWISSAFSFFKEWAGVVLFGTALCCGLVFMLWLVCK